MAKIFKDNEELNNIVNIFYEKADEEKIEDIDAYLSDIESNILLDFDVINSMCKRKNSKISSKLIKMYLQNLLYKYVGVKNNSFYKTMDNNLTVDYLQKEQNDYYTNFASNFDEIEMVLIHSLKKYYEIVKEFGTEEDLKEIYAIYQTVGLYIINMLPEYYRRDFDANELFEDLNSINYEIEGASNRYIINIDYILRDYIKEKYNVDLFDYTHGEQRKRLIAKKTN